jgi:hypothetical protein
MQRMRELIREVQSAYPRDTFFANVNETLRQSSQARAQYRAYDRAFSLLDPESWIVLSRKALAHFQDHRQGQLKQGFFHQLNDAFAYQYLLRRGHSPIRVLREGKTRSPDLSYFSGGSLHHCEVKSIGISQEEILRRHPGEYVNRNAYRSLSDGFLGKLDADLVEANKQIQSRGTYGLVFVVATFDDFTLSYYERYREQISAFLAAHPVPEVYVKIGLIGGRRIHKAGA